MSDILIKHIINKINNYNSNFNFNNLKKSLNVLEQNFWKIYLIDWLWMAEKLIRIKADEKTILSWILFKFSTDINKIEQLKNKFDNDIINILYQLNSIENLLWDLELKNISIEITINKILDIWKDIRVLLVKLSEILYNIDNLEYYSVYEKYKISFIALEIFLPITYILSIWEFRWDIEDKCFKIYKPDEYDFIYSKLWNKYELYYKKIKNIENYVSKILKNKEISFSINWRVKSFFSIYKKMKNRKLPIELINDVIALRIVCNNKNDIYKILWLIHWEYKSKYDKFKDYISSPKNNWYQAVHTSVFDNEWDIIEFQILTEEMADFNKFWLASHFLYKKNIDFKKLPKRISNNLVNLNGNDISENFYNKIHINYEFFNDKIFCLNENWEQFELPPNSTVLDFAYANSNLFWNNFSWAFINWVFYNDPLTLLKDWDIIKIIKSNFENNDYNIDYIDLVKTSKARDWLKNIFIKQSKEQRILLWKHLLDKKLQILWYQSFEFMPSYIINNVLIKFWYFNKDDLYDDIVLWNYKIDNMLIYLIETYKKKNPNIIVDLIIELKMFENSIFELIWKLMSNLDINLKSFKLNAKKIFLKINVSNLIEVQNIILELKRLPNVLSVKRKFPNSLVYFNILLFIFVLLIILNPLLLIFLKVYFNTLFVNNFEYFIIWMTFVFMFFIIFYFKQLTKKNLPDLFNKRIFRFYMFLLNTIVLLSLSIEIFFINEWFPLILFFFISIVVYTIFLYEFLFLTR